MKKNTFSGYGEEFEQACFETTLKYKPEFCGRNMIYKTTDDMDAFRICHAYRDYIPMTEYSKNSKMITIVVFDYINLLQ